MPVGARECITAKTAAATMAASLISLASVSATAECDVLCDAKPSDRAGLRALAICAFARLQAALLARKETAPSQIGADARSDAEDLYHRTMIVFDALGEGCQWLCGHDAEFAPLVAETVKFIGVDKFLSLAAAGPGLCNQLWDEYPNVTAKALAEASVRVAKALRFIYAPYSTSPAYLDALKASIKQYLADIEGEGADTKISEMVAQYATHLDLCKAALDRHPSRGRSKVLGFISGLATVDGQCGDEHDKTCLHVLAAGAAKFNLLVRADDPQAVAGGQMEAPLRQAVISAYEHLKCAYDRRVADLVASALYAGIPVCLGESMPTSFHHDNSENSHKCILGSSEAREDEYITLYLERQAQFIERKYKAMQALRTDGLDHIAVFQVPADACSSHDHTSARVFLK